MPSLSGLRNMRFCWGLRVLCIFVSSLSVPFLTKCHSTMCHSVTFGTVSTCLRLPTRPVQDGFLSAIYEMPRGIRVGITLIRDDVSSIKAVHSGDHA